jgi:D-serine deaminase-like pyridoxal phosphate-dependent protein
LHVLRTDDGIELETIPVDEIVAWSDAERIATPFLAIDLDGVRRNIAAMQAFFDGKTARLRPHVKTHKCSELALMQVAAGAIGVTCSTTDEVRAMAAAGIDDILLANVVTDASRLRSLAEVGRAVQVMAAVDSPEAARCLSNAAVEAGSTLGALVEIDIGMRRNGVPDVASGLALATVVGELPGLELRGVMGYEGHIVGFMDRAERRTLAVDSYERAVELLTALRDAGFDAPVLTGSSTSTYDATGVLAAMTDVQAGTYVLMDATYRELTPEVTPAAVAVASVLTSRRDGPLVLDIGVKRLGSDWGKPSLIGYSASHGYTAEEHCVFTQTGPGPAVGQRVALLPPHICTTMNLYRSVAAFSGGRFDRMLELDGRDPKA